MWFLPYRRFRLTSPLPSAEVAARLAAAVEPIRWTRWLWGRPGRPFEGEAGPSGFRVTRIIRYNNGFRPVVRGRVLPAPDGSVVEGAMAMHLWVTVFMAVWMAMAGLAVVACGLVFLRDGVNGRWRPELLFPVGMLAFGWAVMTGGFALETRWSLAALREVVGAAPPGERGA
jgi:hypothetical protein